MPKEQPKIEQKETKRPKHEIELEQRPMPQEGEGYDKWLERIGGNNFKIAEDLEKYQKPKKKESWPLFIDSKGSFVINDKNIAKFYGEKDRNKLEDWIEKRIPHIKKFTKEGRYQIEKELFNQNPDLYFKAIAGALKGNHEIVADKRFGESVEKWVRELKGEKVEEKVEEKERQSKKKPAATREKKQAGKEKSKPQEKVKETPKKEPTLDEEIAAKQKELEDIERRHNIYYSPVVKSLMSLYYDKRLKDLRKDLKDLEKGKPAPGKKPEKISEPKTIPEEIPERPTIKDYLNHIRETDKLFTEMALTRGKVKRKELKPEEYEKAKAKWREAFRKTLDMESGFDPKTIDKIIKIGAKERKKKKEGGPFKRAFEKVKKIAKALWNLIVKRIGKEIVYEVKKDAIKLDLKEVEARLAVMKAGVRSRMNRTVLEKEQKRLEKKLKQLKK